MKKPKIVIASNIMGMGGAERTVQTIALGLHNTQFDCQVVCLESGGSRVAALEAAGVPVIIGNGTVEAIARHFEPGEIDVLHFHRSGHTEKLHTALVAALKPKKLMETNVFAFTDSELGPLFDLQVYKSLMMLTQRVWRGSLPTQDFPWHKQRVIYNPVTITDFARYTISKAEREKRRADLGFLPEHIVVGRIGRNDPVKWGDLVLSVLPQLVLTEPNIRFVFQTLPDNRRAWLKKKGYLGKTVVVLDETTDEAELAALYQVMDIYVHPSRRGEAFGNTLNEAMVWSLPIVVENTPHWDNGQLEQVLHQKTGLVVKTAGGMMAALVALARDMSLRNQYGIAGRAHVQKTFDLHSGMSQYVLAYQQLLGLVNTAELESALRPTAAEIKAYLIDYPAMKDLDTVHQTKISLELAHWWRTYAWRVQDSLKARGFFA